MFARQLSFNELAGPHGIKHPQQATNGCRYAYCIGGVVVSGSVPIRCVCGVATGCSGTEIQSLIKRVRGFRFRAVPCSFLWLANFRLSVERVLIAA
ncbi:MAG: hypothetical protein ACI87E_000616 [Mariniblastus sp.]|jgi:hypothetical protein